MEPRVKKRDRKLHVSYELPHRIHTALIYPIAAPNGSSVILYGYDAGLRVLWRGGRRRKAKRDAAKLKPSSSAQSDIIIIDSDEEEPRHADEPEPEDNAAFEAEDDELDPDAPCLPIIEDLDIVIGTDVLHLAVPTFTAPVIALAPHILQSSALVAVSSADGSLRILQIPLEPPPVGGKDAAIAEIGRSQIELAPAGPVPSCIAAKLVTSLQTQAHHSSTADSRSQKSSGALLVTSVGQSLKIWQIRLDGGELVEPERHDFKSQQLPASTTKVSFHPSSRSGQLLLVDSSGSVRMYDTFATLDSRRDLTSSEDVLDMSAKAATPGAWVMAYHAAFRDAKNNSDKSAVLAPRKRILDARWILTGKAILALLEDGEWGIWDVTGTPYAGKAVGDFVLHGYLGSSATGDGGEPSKQTKGRSKLAPMTPNTRRAKSEVLFAGRPKVAGVAPRGGISVSSSTPRPGQADESVVMWFNSEVYSIASMHAFWQRSMSGGGSFGSLYAPDLAQIPDVNLVNESATSISQFDAKATAAGLGQMNTARDLLISAERRLIIVQTLRPSTPSRALFQQAAERPVPREDQIMLDVGEPDIANVERMLDSMAAGRARKVGFIH